MTEQPNYGPYEQWEAVHEFSRISEEAFTVFDQVVSENWSQLSRPVHHLWLRMAYQAKSTSMAIRLSNSWCLNLPAFALTRVRLEQLIVCSYLIHEEPSAGLERFIMYIPIGKYNAAREATSDPTIAEQLRNLDLDALRDEARRAQSELNPGLSTTEDRFERKWTQLDLRSMAKRRDMLARQSDYVLKQSLEREYVTIYKQASSVVHADCLSLSYAFLDLFPSPSGTPVLMPVPTWAPVVAATTAHYDVLQCYEILRVLGLPADDQVELMRKWRAARDRHVK